MILTDIHVSVSKVKVKGHVCLPHIVQQIAKEFLSKKLQILYVEHGDSPFFDDVTSVLYFRFLKKNKNKVVSNRCNRCVDSSRDHTNNEMASQYFF